MHDRTPYTPGTRELIRLSKAEAGRLGHDYVGPEHFALAMIRKGNGLAVEALRNLQVDLEALKTNIEQDLEVGKGPNVNLFRPNDEAKKVLETSSDIAIQMRHTWLGSEHLLLALLKVEGTVPFRHLRELGVTLPAVQNVVTELLDGLASRPIDEQMKL